MTTSYRRYQGDLGIDLDNNKNVKAIVLTVSTSRTWLSLYSTFGRAEYVIKLWLGSDHFIIGGGGWKTFWKNNLALLLAEKSNLAQPVCWKNFLFWYVAKKIILPQPWKLKKDLASTLRIKFKKILPSILSEKKKSGFKWCVNKNPALTSTEKNNLPKKTPSSLLPLR